MPQKISISRWNLGEAGPRSAGDFEQEYYPTSCRVLRNFVVSETGKIYRRPGFVHQVKVTPSDVKLISFYRREDTFVLMFYLTGTHPTQLINIDWYQMVDDVLTFQATYTIDNGGSATFKADDFLDGRPATVDIKRISHVQLEDDLIFTHPNMEDPWDLRFNTSGAPGVFVAENFSASNRSWYYDIAYDGTPTPSIWSKLVQTDLAAGGGAASGGDAGWTAYTGEEFTGVNNGKGPQGTPPQTFKYLTCVTFSFERLVWARGSYVHGSAGGDPDGLGIQLNGDNDPATYDVDPFQLLASDPFIYQASSDLGYEDFYWLASGSLLMGGANNGAWVLSNAQAGGLDATNPLMYKSTSHGAYWVPGKIMGDAMLYFQRPGRQLNEFIFNNATQNYEAGNLNEFAGHIFYDYQPSAMEIQRSPFNVAWMVRSDGALVSFSYDRLRGIFAWAQHPFTSELTETTQHEGGHVNSLCIFSDGLLDTPVVHITRENDGGTYHALEVMGKYTPADTQGVFCDAAIQTDLEDQELVTDNVSDPSGNIIHTDLDVPVNTWVKFIDATRVDDGSPATGEDDYIYGAWEIFDVVAVGEYRIRNEIGIIYTGLDHSGYLNPGSIRPVMKQPADSITYAHLTGVFCVTMMDGNPHPIYVSKSGDKFYNSDIFPEDWDGDEGDLDDMMLNKIWFNHLIIGRSYESVFSPFIMKKQIHKGKVTKIELELFRSLGGKVGTANVGLDDTINAIKVVDITYPSQFNEFALYNGTVKPQVVGGYGDDPLWFVLVEEAVPFNIMNVIYYVEAN